METETYLVLGFSIQGDPYKTRHYIGTTGKSYQQFPVMSPELARKFATMTELVNFVVTISTINPLGGTLKVCWFVEQVAVEETLHTEEV